MKHLFYLLVLSGLVPVVVSVPRRFYLVKQTMTWSDAQIYCRANHQDLVTTESADDVMKLNNLGSSGWVGLYLSWRWSLGNQEVEAPKFWYPGYSGDSLGCGVINTNGWWNAPCYVSYYFICYDDSNTGTSRYILYFVNYSWYDAQIFCRQHHTDLASDRNATEHSQILGVIQQNTVWFGLFSGRWKWSDKTLMGYIPRISGQPSNYRGPNNCAYFNTGGMFDSTCSNLMPFFCYGIITGQQQIVKVKVRSNQNVNNATMISMLEMIELKLKKLGVSGLTVRWRKQPDGRVLQK